jgi:hypothetical protein
MAGRSKQSIEVKCEAARDLKTGVTNCFLVIDPGVPPKGEYLLTMLRRTSVSLKLGSYYRITFEEIDPPLTKP